MERYFAAVRAPIERHGGTVEKFIGDAVMAVFGVPELHEDDALRAVRAAVDASRSRSCRGDEIAGRIGLSTGEVHVISASVRTCACRGRLPASPRSSSNGRRRRGPARDDTYRLVRDAVRAESDGRRVAFDEVVPGAPYARRLDAPLIGREAELDRLRGAYANACADKPLPRRHRRREAGIGKTRLARELVPPLRERAQVLIGRCVSYGEGATYLPIAEIVRQAAGEPLTRGDPRPARGEEDADVVAQRVAELVRRRGVSSGTRRGVLGRAPVRSSRSRARGRSWSASTTSTGRSRRSSTSSSTSASGRGRPSSSSASRAARPSRRASGLGRADVDRVPGRARAPPEEALGAFVLSTRRQSGRPGGSGADHRAIGRQPSVRRATASLARSTGAALDEDTGDGGSVARQPSRPPRSARARSDAPGRRDRPSFYARGARRPLARRRCRSTSREPRPNEVWCVPWRTCSASTMCSCETSPIAVSRKRSAPTCTSSPGKGLDRRDGTDELVGYHFEQAYRYLTELQRDDEHARDLAAAGSERLGRAGIRAWKRADAPAAVNLLSRAVDLVPEAAELACELGSALRMRGDVTRAEEVLVSACRVRRGARPASCQDRAWRFCARSMSPTAPVSSSRLRPERFPSSKTRMTIEHLGRAWLSIGHVRGGFYCEYGAWEEAAARASEHYRRAGWSPSTSLGDLACALYLRPARGHERNRALRGTSSRT